MGEHHLTLSVLQIPQIWASHEGYSILSTLQKNRPNDNLYSLLSKLKKTGAMTVGIQILENEIAIIMGNI